MTVLEQLALSAQQRVAAAKEAAPLNELRESALTIAYAQREGKANDPCPARDETPRGPLFGFGATLVKPTVAFIPEIKKASPTQGVIVEDFNYEEIAQDIEAAGAEALSCQTEPQLFQGSEEIFGYCRLAQGLPMLRKDIVVDEYQLYQSKLLGAQAIWLMASLADKPTLKRYLSICDELAMDALVEANTFEDIATADAAGARIICGNNWSFEDAKPSLTRAQDLRRLIPWDCVYVINGCMRTAKDVAKMARAGADALIIGQAFMLADNKKALLDEFRAAAAEAVHDHE